MSLQGIKDGLMALLGLKFQYNSCVGSSLKYSNSKTNSSLFQYNSCVGSRLEPSSVSIVSTSFQYNSCVGSSLKIYRC